MYLPRAGYAHEELTQTSVRENLPRALLVNPDLIICDEPVSALNVSIRVQVLNTLQELQDEYGLTYLFIVHDLSVIRHISDRVAVMYLEKLVEVADKEELFENPRYPCTRALLEPIPDPDPRDSGTHGLLKGDVPGPLNPLSGYRFRTRYSHLTNTEWYHGDSEPIEYQITREEWKQLRVFIRAISCRTLEECGRNALELEFFENHFTQGAAGEFVEEALSLADGQSITSGLSESVCLGRVWNLPKQTTR